MKVKISSWIALLCLLAAPAALAQPCPEKNVQYWQAFPPGGHQMSLAIAAGLGLGGNESYPDLFQPYGGFPDGVKVHDSFVTLPELPGIGFEGKADLFREMRRLSGQ